MDAIEKVQTFDIPVLIFSTWMLFICLWLVSYFARWKKFLSRFSTLYMSGECVLSTLLSILVDDPVDIKKLYGKVCVVLAYKF